MMMLSLPPWQALALVSVTSVFLPHSNTVVSAQQGVRLPVSPSFRGTDPCPARCIVTGPDSANWPVSRTLGPLGACQQTLFLDFSLSDRVDDESENHRIFSCSSYGSDWANLPNGTAPAASARVVNATYELGWWSNGVLAAGKLRELSSQLQQYLASGYGTTDRPVVLFGLHGTAAAGLYIGKGLQNEGSGAVALGALERQLPELDIKGDSLAVQLCGQGRDADHVFGFMATSNTSFGVIQDAVRSWSNATCLSFDNSTQIHGSAFLTTPDYSNANATSLFSNATTSNLTARANLNNPRRQSTGYGLLSGVLTPRADCTTVQVVSGDTCASLATKCGISGATFTQYNPSSTLCSTLQPFQHVCCSSGTLPDFAPKPNADGSCASYNVKTDDSCAAIAAAHSLTVNQLIGFNSQTWGWNGCTILWVGIRICLSSGTPPMPAPVQGVVCGPQVPGTPVPPSGTDLSTLNPCPLNACCDVWGQCGTTTEFCVDTRTGAPGTAAPGTNGCISNCGTAIVRSAAPAVFRSIGYFEGFGLDRPCLYQDARQLDLSQYTHVHFAFATLTSDYQVQVGDLLSSYEFGVFRALQGPKRILSIGGWVFSTSPSTYLVFREGVKPANRVTMARNIANFINSSGLDGVDIDWEYPGATDIKPLPAGDIDEGTNFLYFLIVLKNLLPGKSVSIAAPASYWYLKNFPIAQMSQILDYIVYMTYDLHGQWDATNQWSQPGCPSGMCLRSHVNLTETINALSMITKAGVPSNKIAVGVSSYGRSFAMADASCYGEHCFYTGSPAQSNAVPGPCTGTGGYISNAELKAIMATPGRVQLSYLDGPSHSDIMVYDGNQWVGWMGSTVKASRRGLYQQLSMGGVSDWATDLEDFHDKPPPAVAPSWEILRYSVNLGIDIDLSGTRTGNWVTTPCSDPAVNGQETMSPLDRWEALDAGNAWYDVVQAWQNRHTDLDFSNFIAGHLHAHQPVNCRDKGNTPCDQEIQCAVYPDSGAAAFMVWNSITQVHGLYKNYIDALFDETGVLALAMSDFENTFAPIPPPPDNTWIQILLDLVSMGATMVAGPFLKGVLSGLASFKDFGMEGLKDGTHAVIAASASIGKDVVTADTADNWSVDSQAKFGHYMANVVTEWVKVAEGTLALLFSGTDDGIDALTRLIKDGRFVSGGHATDSTPPPIVTKDVWASANKSLTDSVAKAFFGYAIPAIWTASGAFPFVIDSGIPCNLPIPAVAHVTADILKTATCCNGNLYYLAGLSGKPLDCGGQYGCEENNFSALHGMDALAAGSFGGIETADIIQGAVNTYVSNRNQNGAPIADPADDTILTSLDNQDVTTPGFIRLPVCNPAMAFAAWLQGHTEMDNYPCIGPQLSNLCGASSFHPDTTDASPLVSDCQQLVRNLQAGVAWDSGVFKVESFLEVQHGIANYGTCVFGVQAIGTAGNVNFYVGSQDIVDLITDSIGRFTYNGKVGAHGSMPCKGTINNQPVSWGLYHS